MSSASTNINPTPAQEEFQDFIDKNTDRGARVHPEDRDAAQKENDNSDQDEEDRYRASQIDAAMRTPNVRPEVNLPPASFDQGRSTGVKGVIADARAYEQARQNKWRNRVRAARRSVFGLSDVPKSNTSQSGESDDEPDQDEEAFLQQWRENRRQQLENDAKNGIKNSRRTSPSLRVFGRFDSVDALGYLDSIERVGRETTVVVFVYDHEVSIQSTTPTPVTHHTNAFQKCQVSALVEKALRPLVSENATTHFVKVHYEDIEFDNAAVPTVLAYRNQGDLVANLTGIIEMIPEEEEFDTDSLRGILQKNQVL
jgi:hypothetical protein